MLDSMTDYAVGVGDFFYFFGGFGYALNDGGGAAGVEFDDLPFDGFIAGDFFGEGVE